MAYEISIPFLMLGFLILMVGAAFLRFNILPQVGGALFALGLIIVIVIIFLPLIHEIDSLKT